MNTALNFTESGKIVHASNGNSDWIYLLLYIYYTASTHYSRVGNLNLIAMKISNFIKRLCSKYWLISLCLFVISTGTCRIKICKIVCKVQLFKGFGQKTV